MIKKIKKYKISVRPFAVLRQYKKVAETKEVPESMEQRLEGEIQRVMPSISPSAVFKSYTRDETPEPLKVLWEKSPKKALSLSVMFVSIGSDLEKEIVNKEVDQDQEKKGILNSIAQISLEQAGSFVTKLVTDEALGEGCELTPLMPVEPSLLRDLSSVLESHKANIVCNDQGQMSPLFSSGGFCFWNPVRKSRSGRSR